MQFNKRPYGVLIESEHLLEVYRERFEWLPIFNGEPPTVVFTSDPEALLMEYDRNLNRIFLNVAGMWFGDVVDWMRRELKPYSRKRSILATASVSASLQGLRDYVCRAMMLTARDAVYRMEEVRVPHDDVKAIFEGLTSINPHYIIPELLHSLCEAQANLWVVSARGQYLPHKLATDVSKRPLKSSQQAGDEWWARNGKPWMRNPYRSLGT